VVCEAPSRPPGGGLGLWGHGLRSRFPSGPPAADAEPVNEEVPCRRYLCLHCDAVIVVVPRGILPRRQYTASAIALALTLWASLGRTPREVRRRVSPSRIVGASRPGRWVTLARWSEAARRGTLFGQVRPIQAGTRREVAARVAMVIVAEAPPGFMGLGLEVQAFEGGARMR